MYINHKERSFDLLADSFESEQEEIVMKPLLWLMTLQTFGIYVYFNYKSLLFAVVVSLLQIRRPELKPTLLCNISHFFTRFAFLSTQKNIIIMIVTEDIKRYFSYSLIDYH